MYAIVETGGFQFRVEPGCEIEVPRMQEEVGSRVSLARILYMEKEDGSRLVGMPTVANAQAEAEVVSHGRGDKVLVFKFKKRKKYRRLRGFRSHHTRLKILSISGEGAGATAE